MLTNSRSLYVNVRVGDELVIVNSQSLSNISRDEAADIFNRLPCGPVHLQVMRHPEVCSSACLPLAQRPRLTIAKRHRLH